MYTQILIWFGTQTICNIQIIQQSYSLGAKFLINIAPEYHQSFWMTGSVYSPEVSSWPPPLELFCNIMAGAPLGF